MFLPHLPPAVPQARAFLYPHMCGCVSVCVWCVCECVCVRGCVCEGVCLLGMLINSQHTWRATVAHLSWNIAWFLVSLGILRYPALSLGILGLRVGSSPAIKNSGHVHVNSIKQHITYKPDYNHHHQQQPSRVESS